MIKRILISGYTKNFGGIERTVTNLFLGNTEKYVFDFLCSNSNKEIKVSDVFSKSGSNIFYLDTSIKNGNRHIREFFKKNSNKYDGILVNFGDISDARFLKYAKRNGINKRIAYAHMGFYDSNSFIKKILWHFFKNMIHFNATSLLSYSEKASEVTYLKKDQKRARILIPLNSEKYHFDMCAREFLRERYEIKQNDIVVGCVGSISENKNQISLINIVQTIAKNFDKKFILILVGDIVDENYKHQLHNVIQNISAKLRVILIDNQQDIEKYYSMFDIYFSASKKEGFGLTIIEAHISGLPIIANRRSLPDSLIKCTNPLEVDINNEDECNRAISLCLQKNEKHKRGSNKIHFGNDSPDLDIFA